MLAEAARGQQISPTGLEFWAVGERWIMRLATARTITATLAGKTITFTFGRPYVKGRKIFGELAPFNKVWRTEADEATGLKTEAMLDIRGLSVPPGRYSLHMVPG